jgi:predicted nucleic acid-binding protein
VSRSTRRLLGALVLDSEGLSRAIRQDVTLFEWLATARAKKAPVITSAATLVEVMHPGLNRSALDWTLSRLKVEPVTKTIARHAAVLLSQTGRHGHTYAIDAMVAATALAAPGPVTLLTSDPKGLTALCGDRVVVVGL